LFCGFCNFSRCKLEKKQGEEEHPSTKLADGMGGVMNEGGLEGWKLQKHMQVNVEDGALDQCSVNEEQVQASVEVGETFTTNLATIEIDLQKIIEMIVEQENVAFVFRAIGKMSML
jgi:hypothetical protein